MKSDEEAMEILEAFDLTKSMRGAADLCGCDHHTVASWVARRDAGELGEAGHIARERVADGYRDKIEEWVEASHARVRADIVHDKLIALGYGASERTTRRAVAAAKASWRSGQRRRYRPWIPEPGMWCQFDYGEGPVIGGVRTQLFCAWLAWSRFRVVIPILDKTLPSVIAALDTTLRRFNGVPTYALTDNEKTVSTTHVARIPVRHPEMVAFGRHYGLTVATCMPADPETKGGAESTVRVAKADLVPTEANLLPAYGSFGELAAACEGFCAEVNARAHRVTRRIPAEMLAEERTSLHPLPTRAYTGVFGVTRVVGAATPVISFDAAEYSVPDAHAGEVVWVRHEGDQVVVVAVGPAGATEIARHRRGARGERVHNPDHFAPMPETPLGRTPKATNPAEAAFLALGQGAAMWLKEAAASGTARIRTKMAEAVDLSRLHGTHALDRALGAAAVAGRFGEGDVVSILVHLASAGPGSASQASGAHSLQPGTGAWKGFGR